MESRIWKSISEVREANKANGYFWFSESTMRCFRSKVCTGIMFDRYFVSSEKDSPNPRLYTIRMVRDDGSIRAEVDPPRFSTLAAAIDCLKKYGPKGEL